MSNGLGFWRMATMYPDVGQLGPADVEMVQSWASLRIAAFIEAHDNLPLLMKVWSQKPTMVHPTHVAPLAAELRLVLEFAATAGEPNESLHEFEAAISFVDDVGARGQWLVTIGP